MFRSAVTSPSVSDKACQTSQVSNVLPFWMTQPITGIVTLSRAVCASLTRSPIFVSLALRVTGSNFSVILGFPRASKI